MLIMYRDIIMARDIWNHNGMPALIGSDFSGVVVDVGTQCSRLRLGDFVYGMSRLGLDSHSPFQQHFLADEDLTLKKPENTSSPVAASMGVGVVVCDYIRTTRPKTTPRS